MHVCRPFIAETLGAGIQHIAFRTEDIFATAEALRSNGFNALPISSNYYGDIEARFGLLPSLSETGTGGWGYRLHDI